jgi:thioredoxin-like negative regulator of GroEL
MENINIKNILLVIFWLILLYIFFNEFILKKTTTEPFTSCKARKNINENYAFQQAEADQLRIQKAREMDAVNNDNSLVHEAKQNELLNKQKENDYQTQFLDNDTKNIVVYNFNTEWCGHSKQFQPIWDAFTSSLSNNANVKAFDVKCDNDKNKDLCAKFKVQGFPTVILVINSQASEYNGPRSVDGLRKAVNLQVAQPPIKEKEKQNETLSKPIIYNFNTEWCGYSKQFQPIWDEFSKKVNNSVQVMDIKCDDDTNKELCNRYDIPGFPSVVLVENDNVTNFNGPRTVDGLIEFVNKSVSPNVPSSSPKTIIYNFNTEWCGYSKQFQPIWNTFANSIKGKDNTVALDVKCDDDKNKELCNKYDIEGYPSVLIVRGDKVEKYSGPRTVEGLKNILK